MPFDDWILAFCPILSQLKIDLCYPSIKLGLWGNLHCRPLLSHPLFFALLKQEMALCSLCMENLPRALHREISQGTFSCSLFLLASGQHSPAGVIYQQIRRKRKERKKERKMSNRKRFGGLLCGHGPSTTSWCSIALEILAHVVQMQHGPSVHLRSPPRAGYGCKAVSAPHAVDSIFIWK